MRPVTFSTNRDVDGSRGPTDLTPFLTLSPSSFLFFLFFPLLCLPLDRLGDIPPALQVDFEAFKAKCILLKTLPIKENL
jgi:hypothetical protein